MTKGISPKVIATTITAVIAYLLGQPILDIPPVGVVALTAVATALAGYLASPGDVITDTPGASTNLPADDGGER